MSGAKIWGGLPTAAALADDDEDVNEEHKTTAIHYKPWQMAQGWWPAISPSIDDLQCTSTSNSRAGTDGVKRVVGKADLNK